MSNSKKCPVCRTELQQDFKVCTECGERISKILKIKNNIQRSTGAEVTVIWLKFKIKGFSNFAI